MQALIILDHGHEELEELEKALRSLGTAFISTNQNELAQDPDAVLDAIDEETWPIIAVSGDDYLFEMLKSSDMEFYRMGTSQNPYLLARDIKTILESNAPASMQLVIR